MRILVLCPERAPRLVERAVGLISSRCHQSWRDEGYIGVQLAGDDREAATQAVNKFARKKPGRVFLVHLGNARVVQTRLNDKISSVHFPSAGAFRREFPNLLSETNLDLTGYLIHKAGLFWEPGPLDRETLDSWIRQFEVLSSHRWVAEGLLRVLDFWPPARVLEALGLSRDGLEGFDCVAVNRFDVGRSGDALAPRIRKRLRALNGPNLPILDLSDAVDHPAFGRVLFLEDCLLTGDELERTFKSMTGNLHDGRKPRARQLVDIGQLDSTKIVLRYAVVSDWGSTSLETFRSSQSLEHLLLDKERSKFYGLLTTKGLAEHKTGNLRNLSGSVRDADACLAMPAFAGEAWGGEEKGQKAMNFCQEIGFQLFDRYLKARGKEWDSERIQQAGLGCGIALAFSHSVPKVTLPVFWMGGPCTYEGKTINWQPLFQFAM